MTSAIGTKNSTAASTHKLIEEVPLCAAAAIQRGPKTVAMLKKSTSQKPISRQSWLRGSGEASAWLTGLHPTQESTRPAFENCEEMDRSNFQILSRKKTRSPSLPAETRCCPQAAAQDAYRASQRSTCDETSLSTAK